MKNKSGFVPLPYTFSDEVGTKRYLYCKQHEVIVESDTKPSERTLFVLNVPQYLNEDCVQLLFKECGPLERICFHNKPSASETYVKSSKFFSPEKMKTGYKVAYVVFKEVTGLKKALKLCHRGVQTVPVHNMDLNVGMRKWISEYNNSFPDAVELQKELDAFMSEYDKKENELKQEALKKDGVPDEEGWITVTKHSKKTKIVPSEKNKSSSMPKQSKKSLLNFYRFQIRETNSEQIAQLRKRFEEDKERIVAMKATRKFRPY